MATDELDDDGYEVLDLGPAAEHLGVSPDVLARLLDSGALPWRRTDDVMRRTVRLTDLEAHRDARYALHQRLAAEVRARHSGEPDLLAT